jgi:hypothetical protein
MMSDTHGAELPPGVTAEDLRQATQIRDFFTEAIHESPDIPTALRAAMAAAVRDNLAGLVASHGPEMAAVVIAEVAYLAGRKAERAGLMHIRPTLGGG